MPRIAQRTIDEIRQRVSLVDVVSPYVNLKRAGSSWKGLSPFNQEKTPSFYVHPDRGFFKCFSSGNGGDCFRFVQLVENVGFYEAIELLAQRFNIPMEYEEGAGGPSREQRSLVKEIRDIHQVAVALYREHFLAKNGAGAAIRAYWTEQRGFKVETAEHWQIGLAPPDGGGLLEKLRKQGFSEKAVAQAGLFFERNFSMERAFPRFRGRLMVPIRDTQGREVAFTARQLPSTPADDPAREAKYVNSPETPVFSKSDILFGLDQARRTAGPDKPFLMVEGQLDAIRCWETGLQTAIAPQGTAVTERQMRLIQRYDAPLEVLLDGDAAGQKAALRMLPLALAAGIEPRFLTLPEGSDPDDLLREGGAAALASLRGTRLERAIPFAVRSLLPDGRTPDAQEKVRALRQLFESIEKSDSAILETSLLEETARALRVDLGAARAEYQRFKARRRGLSRQPEADEPRGTNGPSHGPDGAPAARQPTENPSGKRQLTDAETDILWLVLRDDELADQIAQIIDLEWLNRETIPGRVLGRVLAAVLEGFGTGSEVMRDILETDEEWNLVGDLQLREFVVEIPAFKATEALRRLFRRHIESRLRSIDQKIANLAGDFSAMRQLQEEKIQLRKQLRHPPAL